MKSFKNPTTFALMGGLVCLAAAGAVGSYASDVHSVTPGFLAAGDPFNAVGAPVGGGPSMGGTDVYQLGVGGDVTYELATAAFNGRGTDLIVYENPFLVSGTLDFETWAEVCTVEVSTNSFDWAAFPTDYRGLPGPFGLFQGIPRHWFRGFAGVATVGADPFGTGVDPLDVVAGGGDAFDFDDLLDDPNVVAGLVDLEEIRYVRLTDIQGGQTMDADGDVIWDCGDPAFACTDIDALCAVNNVGGTQAGRPWVDLSIQEINGNEWIILDIGDPDGLWQVTPSITASNNGLSVNFYGLLPYFVFLELDGFHVKMAAGPLIPAIPDTEFRVAVEDPSGLRGGDVLHFP